MYKYTNANKIHLRDYIFFQPRVQKQDLSGIVFHSLNWSWKFSTLSSNIPPRGNVLRRNKVDVAKLQQIKKHNE